MENIPKQSTDIDTSSDMQTPPGPSPDAQAAVLQENLIAEPNPVKMEPSEAVPTSVDGIPALVDGVPTAVPVGVDGQDPAAQAVNYSMVQAGQMSEGDYANMMNVQQVQPYPTGMLPAVPQQPTYSVPSTPPSFMDILGNPATKIPPYSSSILPGNTMSRALTLGYGSQTTTFYQMPSYSPYGVGILVGNTWEGEEVDENTPPGKHGTFIVTPDHRQFHILASISDSRVGQLHLLNTGDTDPNSGIKVIQNTIPNHYRSAVNYIHKMFVCEFVDKKFYVQACEPGAEKFSGQTSTLAWTSALRHYCPQRTSCRLSGPLYFGFAIPAVQELCPGLKYVARKSGARRGSARNGEDQYESTGMAGGDGEDAAQMQQPQMGMPVPQLMPDQTQGQALPPAQVPVQTEAAAIAVNMQLAPTDAFPMPEVQTDQQRMQQMEQDNRMIMNDAPPMAG